MRFPFCPCFLDPLAPANLTLASPSAFTLQASWTGAEQGGEGYTVELYETSSGSLASRVSLGWDARNHTFWSLSPGTCYSMRVSAAAGPYHAIAPNLTHWTREYHPLLQLPVLVVRAPFGLA